MPLFSPVCLRRRVAAVAVGLSLGCLATTAGAAPPTLLHSFAPANAQFQNADGAFPALGVIQASGGDWYGITLGGGPDGAGVLFKMHPNGAGFTVLKTFNGDSQNTDGGFPGAPLTRGIDGALYGTTSNGGANGDDSSSPGTIFRLSPTGQFQTLHSFAANDADPEDGGGQVFQASDGVLYGEVDVAPGTLFRMNADGTGYRTIHTFNAVNSDGTNVGGGPPRALTVEGGNGFLYGVAYSGGAHGVGTVFKIAKDGTGFTVLHDFNGASLQDGATPSGNLRKGLDGSFYGTTSHGGANNTGTVFRIDPTGNFRLAVSFPALPANGLNSVGANPAIYAGLTQGADGTLYGTTYTGGANGYGTLFSVRPDGSGLADLFDFRASDFRIMTTTKFDVRFEVTFGSDGLLYVTTNAGGANGSGAIYSLAPPQRTQIVWNHTSDGQVSLWSVASDFTFTQHSYGPYSGWTARAVSDGPDGVAHLLWTNTNGTATVWNIAANGSFTQHVFGPYAGWKAVSLSTSPSGASHLLWDKTDGTASLWTLNTSAGTFTQVSYGPYTGWTANAVADGPNVTDLLWNNVNGAAFGWRLSASGLVNKSFGPYSGWNAQALSVGPDDGAHLLWDNTSGQVALWSVDFATGGFTQGGYGPFSGWTARAIATGPDSVTHLLWNHPSNGQVSLWNVSGSGVVNHEFGPYAGWTATAVSSGP